MTAIAHVAVMAPRDAVEACVAFYALLGFDQVALPDHMAGNAAWIERDGQQVHFLFSSAEEAATPWQGHIAVVCADYDETLARLRAAGVEIDPRSVGWGSPRCFVADPVGNRVEVMEFPPASQR